MADDILPPGRKSAAIRKIIHIDMDAFYAAIEQRDHAEYRGKPLIVGGDPYGRGVVATCSYEARHFGIRSAMSASRALRRCPTAIFVRPRIDDYREVSREIMAILRSYTPLVEPLSLDEAYLDVTDLAQGGTSATRIARNIRLEILKKTGLTASAGVSYNKLLAKLASDWKKPDGLWVIPPGAGEDFLAPLPVGKLHGIGPATVRKMAAMGIQTVADLRRASLGQLTVHFGKIGAWFHDIARGVDPRPVRATRERKSIGYERTFREDVANRALMESMLLEMCDPVCERMQANGVAGRTVTLKMRFADFRLISRAVTLEQAIQRPEDLRPHLPSLMARAMPVTAPVRLLGISMSHLETGGTAPDRGDSQLDLALDE